jgi:hypothetical protein
LDLCAHSWGLYADKKFLCADKFIYVRLGIIYMRLSFFELKKAALIRDAFIAFSEGLPFRLFLYRCQALQLRK